VAAAATSSSKGEGIQAQAAAGSREGQLRGKPCSSSGGGDSGLRPAEASRSGCVSKECGSRPAVAEPAAAVGVAAAGVAAAVTAISSSKGECSND
jgi:hypothetical protein